MAVHWAESDTVVILDGQVITGTCASVTVTVKEQVVELPKPSVTRKVFVVTPGGNTAPL